jgi:hypothetical protein
VKPPVNCKNCREFVLQRFVLMKDLQAAGYLNMWGAEVTSDFFLHKRTYISPTEGLDPFYRPAFRIDPQYKSYFKPTMLTDRDGNLIEDLHEDLCVAAKAGLANYGQVSAPPLAASVQSNRERN